MLGSVPLPLKNFIIDFGCPRCSLAGPWAFLIWGSYGVPRLGFRKRPKDIYNTFIY